MPPDAAATEAELDAAIEHHRSGRLDEAERGYRAILAVDPRQRDALHLLGVVAHQSGRQEEAIRLIQQAITLDGGQAKFHNSLGSVYQALGHTAAAVACYRQSVAIDRDYPEAHHNLGMALLDLRRPMDALGCLERAVTIKPDYANAHVTRGLALKTLGRFTEAAAAFRCATEMRQGFWEAHFQLGNILKDQGRVEEAIQSYERVLEFEPHAFTTWGNLLCTLQYRDGITLDELAAAHARFDQTFGVGYQPHLRPHDNDPNPDRTLRIGLVSPDLHAHPVGFFVVRAIEGLDRKRVATVCYHTSATDDHLTSRMRNASTLWREARTWSDEHLARTIREDAIDILFDLAGHTRDNRLLVFARKPAPIQISWAGYVGTTGLRAIDYLLADEHQVPRGVERHYSERILRMPDGYVSYDPPAFAPPVSRLPALDAGRITFGSFNNQAKLSPRTLEAWSRLLHRVPNSRLMLKYYAMSNAAVSGRLRQQFADHGINAERLVFLGSTPHAQQLEQYREIDIALDPFPYSGGLTTLEALWMGVPVVTCPGETFASRHSLSHLSNVGLTSTIARTPDDYVDIAAALAADLPALAGLRATLRDRLAGSPLCNGERFARHFERLMRTVWREWVARQAEKADETGFGTTGDMQRALSAGEAGCGAPA